MSKNCEVTATFPIYSQFGAFWKPDSRRMVCNTYIVKTELKNLTSHDKALIQYIVLGLKIIFSETTTKFQICSTILKSFTQGLILPIPPPTAKQTP